MYEEDEGTDIEENQDSLPQDDSPIVVPSWLNEDWAQREWPEEVQDSTERADASLEEESEQMDDLINDIENGEV